MNGLQLKRYQTWVDMLLEEAENLFGEYPTIKRREVVQGLAGLLVEMETLVTSLLPREHPVYKTWRECYTKVRIPISDLDVPPSTAEWEFLGLIKAVHRMIHAGNLGSFIDDIVAKTEAELLDQATVLLDSGLIAAAVIAGGALESHLKHLVTKYGLTVSGDGSISKYDGAIAQARNQGTITIYSASDTKYVTAWGSIRNDAAHCPLNFRKSCDEVRLMIEGIRHFIERVP